LNLNSKIDLLFNLFLHFTNFKNFLSINFELPIFLSTISLYDLESMDAPDYYEDPLEIEKF